MQPAPLEHSTESSLQSTQSPRPSSSQHGRHRDSVSASAPSSPGEDAGFDGSTSEWSLSPTGSGSPAEGYDTWLSPSKWDAHQPVSYTGAVNSSRSEHVHIQDGFRADESSLLLLPEELLFHIISYLPATQLLMVKLVSRRFYSLVNSPHAWMNAFSRFFPGPDSLRATADVASASVDHDLQLPGQPAFARLTSITSWSGEYLRRTKLLRCIVRGRPALPFACPAPGNPDKGMATFTFSTRLGLETSNLHADWGQAMDKRKPQFISGFAGTGKVTSSDRKGKFDSWGISDHNLFRSFGAEHPGCVPYGGPNETIVGLPNMMDLSQNHGMIYAEGTPGGNTFFLGHDEKRGRNLASFTSIERWQVGQPAVQHSRQCTCSVWIAKAPNVPRVLSGMVGMLCGSSSGVVSSYSLGPSARREQRFERGELTVRWLLSPGVPIIALAVDESISEPRLNSKRVWAVALNALGEVFYLTDYPKPQAGGKRPQQSFSEEEVANWREECAWQTGQSCPWQMVPRSSRAVKPDVVFDQDAPSFLPQTFWAQSRRDDAQSQQELRNITAWLKATPAAMQSQFDGWDMQRRLEVDFGGDDRRGAGEHILVVGTTSRLADPDAAPAAKVTRYSHCNLSGQDAEDAVHEWRESRFSFLRYKVSSISTTSLDQSLYATTTEAEDNALGQTRSARESRLNAGEEDSVFKLPGQRARLVAAGTPAGSIFVWNMRSPVPGSISLVHEVEPVRVIHTQSPGITALAISSLLLVHGGAEGLIQAWEPLGSTLEPLRTLTSHRSMNNRRRLVIAARQNPEMHLGRSSPAQFAATNICLDPDPTVLRGVAAVGGFLRYWSYSSTWTLDDHGKPQKRRLKRGAKSFNPTPGENFVGIRRVGLKGFVNQELRVREVEKKEDKAYEKEQRRVAGRFGLDLLGEDASDEDLLAYAKLLSEEEDQLRATREYNEKLTAGISPEAMEARVAVLSEQDRQKWKFASWEERRELVILSGRVTPASLESARPESQPQSQDEDLATALELSLQDDVQHTPRASTPEASSSARVAVGSSEDDALAEAVRLSLLDAGKSSPQSPVSGRRLASPYATPPRGGGAAAQSSEEDDLERAIRLSLEESGTLTPPSRVPSPGSRVGSLVSIHDADEFPSLGAAAVSSSSSSPSSPTPSSGSPVAVAVGGGGGKGGSASGSPWSNYKGKKPM